MALFHVDAAPGAGVDQRQQSAGYFAWEVAGNTQHVAVAGPRTILLSETYADQVGSGGALSIIAVMNAGNSRAAASLML